MPGRDQKCMAGVGAWRRHAPGACHADRRRGRRGRAWRRHAPTAGDADAFRVLVDRYSRSVFRLAYRMVGNEADAEDVVQEAFLRAWRQLENYESRSSFSTWLCRIAANYALDLIRARKRHQAAQLGEEDDRSILDTVRSAEAGPDRLYYGGQVRRTLNSALAELTEQERTASTGLDRDEHLLQTADGLLQLIAVFANIFQRAGQAEVEDERVRAGPGETQRRVGFEREPESGEVVALALFDERDFGIDPHPFCFESLSESSVEKTGGGPIRAASRIPLPRKSIGRAPPHFARDLTRPCIARAGYLLVEGH